MKSLFLIVKMNNIKSLIASIIQETNFYGNSLEMSNSSLLFYDVQKAAEQGIPVMVEAWINAVWEASLTRNVRATDPEFEKHKCPIFLDMYITCSNLKKSEKENMRELITKHGKHNKYF